MVPRYNPYVVGQGLARLTFQFQQPNIRAWLAAMLSECQALEDATWTVLTGRFLATAICNALPATNPVFDAIGTLIGQPRSGLSDSDYKSLLYLRIAVNRAHGQIIDWSNFARILLRTASGPANYYDDQAGILFGVWGMTLNPNLVAQTLSQAPGNGMYAVFAYTTWPDASDFEWSSVTDPVSGELGWGSVYSSSTGGLMVAGVAMR